MCSGDLSLTITPGSGLPLGQSAPVDTATGTTHQALVQETGVDQPIPLDYGLTIIAITLILLFVTKVSFFFVCFFHMSYLFMSLFCSPVLAHFVYKGLFFPAEGQRAF